jgi:hypothetical protein
MPGGTWYRSKRCGLSWALMRGDNKRLHKLAETMIPRPNPRFGGVVSIRHPFTARIVRPGAGHDGGRIVFEGTPSDLVADRSTLTGEHLAAYVGR